MEGHDVEGQSWQQIRDYVKREAEQLASAEREARDAAEQARNLAENSRDSALQARKEATHRLVEEQEKRLRAECDKKDAKAAAEAAAQKLQAAEAALSKAKAELLEAHSQKEAASTREQLMAAARDGAQAAKKKAIEELEKERTLRQAAELQLQHMAGEVLEARSAAEGASHQGAEALQARDTAEARALDSGKQAAAAAEECMQLQREVEALSAALRQARIDGERARHELTQSERERDGALERAEGAQKNRQEEVESERGLRMRSEVQVHEALKELARIEKARQAAQVAQADLGKSLANERRLRKQAEEERDQALELLQEEQRRRRDAEATMEDQAEQLSSIHSLQGQLNHAAVKSSDMEKQMEADRVEISELRLQLQGERQRRSAAEQVWQDTERARREAVKERKDAEKAWQDISEMLAQAEKSRQQAAAAVLAERATRIMAQHTLNSLSEDGAPALKHSETARLELLQQLHVESASLTKAESALQQAWDCNRAALEHCELQGTLLAQVHYDKAAAAQAECVDEERLEQRLEKLEELRQLVAAAQQQAVLHMQAAVEAVRTVMQEQAQTMATLDADALGDPRQASRAARQRLVAHIREAAESTAAELLPSDITGRGPPGYLAMSADRPSGFSPSGRSMAQAQAQAHPLLCGSGARSVSAIQGSGSWGKAETWAAGKELSPGSRTSLDWQPIQSVHAHPPGSADTMPPPQQTDSPPELLVPGTAKAHGSMPECRNLKEALGKGTAEDDSPAAERALLLPETLAPPLQQQQQQRRGPKIYTPPAPSAAEQPKGCNEAQPDLEEQQLQAVMPQQAELMQCEKLSSKTESNADSCWQSAADGPEGHAIDLDDFSMAGSDVSSSTQSLSRKRQPQAAQEAQPAKSAVPAGGPPGSEPAADLQAALDRGTPDLPAAGDENLPSNGVRTARSECGGKPGRTPERELLKGSRTPPAGLRKSQPMHGAGKALRNSTNRSPGKWIP